MSGIVLNLVGGTYGPPPPPAIGSVYGGGFFAGQISTAGNGIADYNLVIGPKASAQANRAGKTSNTGGDPTSVINGPANSATMNSATYPAAQFCEGLTIGGFSDWYLPAKNELDVIYFNLKPTTQSNITSVGINANAVPTRTSNYTAGNPAQTSATDFQGTNAEALTGTPTGSSYYLTSTDFNASPANSRAFWQQSMNGGYQGYFAFKTDPNYPCRALRRVAL
jgi:hypothetical protein